MPQTRTTTAHRKTAQAAGDLAAKKLQISAKSSTPPVENTPCKSPVSVSTRFNPEELDMMDADIILLAIDQVYFYSHQATLLRNSSNHFGSLLPNQLDNANMEIDVFQSMSSIDLLLVPTVVAMPYPSDVLNLLLHMVYRFSVESYKPNPDTLRAAVTALFELGYNIEAVLAPHSEPYMLFLQSAAREPLPTYALAAQHCLESIAVAVSTFTLGVSLSDMSDELASQMGPLYLRRLFFLHLGRTDALRRLLYPPPSPHLSSPNLACNEKDREEVRRIWALASASAVTENHPNNLTKMFAPLYAQLSCVKCRQVFHERVAKLLCDWGAIKSTI